MKIINPLFTFGLFLAINGCSSITVIPGTGSLQTAIVNAYKENDAIRLANEKARQICIVQNQKLKVIDLDTVYQGLDPDQKMLNKLAETVLPKSKTSPPYTPKDYTYKATLTFRCV